MKLRAKDLTDRQRIETLDALYTAASSVRGRDAMKLFLRDLLTGSERIMLGRRILIARQLIAGNHYDDIAKGLRVGNDTIRRVERWLEDQLPGYEKAIAEMERQFARRRAAADIKGTSAIAHLKRKYPLHFLLFPWPKGTGPKRDIYLRK